MARHAAVICLWRALGDVDDVREDAVLALAGAAAGLA
jgi:hypothetical protein